MDFARRQRDPTRHLVGIAFVVLVHALVIYALLTGLARKAVEVIKKPLTATIVEEIKLPPPPPPPPPPKKIVEAPKQQAPVETYVPPPEVPVVAPAPTEPVISAVTSAPPTQPHVIAPPAVAPPPPPPPAPKPAIRKGIVPIQREDPVYPREAIRAGVAKGRVVARLKIDEQGNVTDIDITFSDPPRVFDRAVRQALENWKFKPEGEKYVGEIEVNFTLKDN
jgi:protein TonB